MNDLLFQWSDGSAPHLPPRSEEVGVYLWSAIGPDRLQSEIVNHGNPGRLLKVSYVQTQSLPRLC